MDVAPSSHHGPHLRDLWACQAGVVYPCVSDEFARSICELYHTVCQRLHEIHISQEMGW